MQVAVALTDHFSVALAEASGSCKLYLQALNPQKLNATWMLVQMHTALGHVGMIFCDHLLPAKTLKSVLGARWEVLSGGNAHGTEGSHTAQVNADIVKRFNDGALDGLIATPVGESALDVHNTKFRYAIVIDAHGGQAPASQKLGRLSRTPRVLRKPDESAEDHAKRVKQQQKDGQLLRNCDFKHRGGDGREGAQRPIYRRRLRVHPRRLREAGGPARQRRAGRGARALL